MLVPSTHLATVKRQTHNLITHRICELGIYNLSILEIYRKRAARRRVSSVDLKDISKDKHSC